VNSICGSLGITDGVTSHYPAELTTSIESVYRTWYEYHNQFHYDEHQDM